MPFDIPLVGSGCVVCLMRGFIDILRLESGSAIWFNARLITILLQRFGSVVLLMSRLIDMLRVEFGSVVWLHATLIDSLPPGSLLRIIMLAVQILILFDE